MFSSSAKTNIAKHTRGFDASREKVRNFTVYDVEFGASLENALEIAYLASLLAVPAQFDHLQFVDSVAAVFNESEIFLDQSNTIDNNETCVHVGFGFVSDNETSNHTAEELERTYSIWVLLFARI